MSECFDTRLHHIVPSCVSSHSCCPDLRYEEILFVCTYMRTALFNKNFRLIARGSLDAQSCKLEHRVCAAYNSFLALRLRRLWSFPHSPTSTSNFHFTFNFNHPRLQSRIWTYLKRRSISFELAVVDLGTVPFRNGQDSKRIQFHSKWTRSTAVNLVFIQLCSRHGYGPPFN